MEDVGVGILRPFGLFYGILVYFTAIWYILWTFGLFYGILVYVFYGHLVYFVPIWDMLWHFGIFLPFWYVVPRKIWKPRVKHKYVHVFVSTRVTRG
jgi:hypothetical protein